VHKSLLISASDYFRAAFAGGFKEGETGTLDLSDEDPERFGFILEGIYGRRLNADAIRETIKASSENQAIGYCKLYISLDRYGLVQLKNDLMDSFIKFFGESKGRRPEKCVPYIYENTVESSLLRAFTACLVAYHCCQDPNTLMFYREMFNQFEDFRMDVMKALACNHTKLNDPRDFNERFHEKTPQKAK